MNTISVIVPIYNCEKYLNKCIKSIIDQTYHNLEIILINDGSTDNSLKICKYYQTIDNRVKVINKKNEGVANTRNIGLQYATGDLISFIDGDDYIEKNMFEEMVKNVYEYDIVVCKYVIIKNEKKIHQKYQFHDKLITKEEILPMFLKGEILTAHLWNKLYKKELFYEIKFNKYNMLEDLDIMYKVLEKCKKIKYIDKEYYNYVYIPNSLTKKYSIEMLTDYRDVINNMYNYFSKNINISQYLYFNKIMNLCNLYELIALTELSRKEKKKFDKEYKVFKSALKHIDRTLFKSFSTKTKFKILILSLNKNLFYCFIHLLKGVKK